MRNASARHRAYEELTEAQQEAVDQGRAKISRSGRFVPCAPQATARGTYVPMIGASLSENPNRGKRNAARCANEARLHPERAEDVTLSFPVRDSLGRDISKRSGRHSYTVRRIPSLQA